MQDNVKTARIIIQEKVMANALPRISRSARVAFEKAKAKILDEFDAHPITKAIDQHLWFEGIPGDGTLFGFIGFNDDDEPTENIREILYADFNFIGVDKLGPRTINISYSIPTKQSIFDATPLDGWSDGRSWTEMLETGGIPGVGYYLGKMGQGRSQEGVQAKGSVRTGKFGPHKYISDFLNKSDAKIKKYINEALILT